MKRTVFSLVCTLLLLGFSSCLKSGDNISYYSDVPAIVGISSDTYQPTIITSSGTFLAPELQNVLYTELVEGDAVWAYFNVNYDQPTESGTYQAYNISVYKIATGWPQATGGGGSQAGNFDIPISNITVYDLVQNDLFIVFEHTTVPTDQQMTYEMTYDGNDTSSEPVIYLRAKKDGSESASSVGTLQYPFSFNMSSFFSTHKDSNNKVKFKVKYKTGVDANGNDQYSDYNGGTAIELTVK
jgi:hypothetical protein